MITNDTDETIVIEPGETIACDKTKKHINDSLIETQIDGRVRKVDRSEVWDRVYKNVQKSALRLLNNE